MTQLNACCQKEQDEWVISNFDEPDLIRRTLGIEPMPLPRPTIADLEHDPNSDPESDASFQPPPA